MAAARRLLLLGGTSEASALARRLEHCADLRVITSLAGRTTNPSRPPGGWRTGGFGGADGLAAYLRDEAVDLVVDATHPFAAVMRWHALDACRAAGVPRLRVERPAWTAGPGDRWQSVPSLDAAAAAVREGDARRVFLTIGRTELTAMGPAAVAGRWWLVRSIEAPDPLPLAPAEVVLGRGPFTLERELELMRRHRVDLLVTKNSGGPAAKLLAARELGLPVVVVDRPPSPPGPAAATVDDAVGWLAARAQSGG